jgi:hypothetical protein
MWKSTGLSSRSRVQTPVLQKKKKVCSNICMVDSKIKPQYIKNIL